MPILLLVGAAVVVGPQLVDEAKKQLGDLGGETATEYQVAPGAKPKTDKCTAEQVLKQRRCDDLKVVLIDAAKMPFVSQNIIAAWGDERQRTLVFEPCGRWLRR